MSEENSRQSPYSRAVSRRRFIRTVALSGATLGVVGLGGLGFAMRSGGGSNNLATKAGEPTEAEDPRNKNVDNEEPQETPGPQKMGEFRTDTVPVY